MSRIIRQLQCNSCNKQYNNLYISFGHPDEDFDWHWKCKECGEINIKKIKAMPSAKFDIVLRDINTGEIVVDTREKNKEKEDKNVK